ncbi:hypothetical protein [Vibrio phage BONAISHI]|nr:hypothetical protein [Vibrio phage BONAISHI]
MADETNVPDEAAPVGIDVSPLAVLNVTQAKRMEAILGNNPHDKELERIMANADRTALGQMRITVDENAAEADKQLKQTLIEAIAIPSANPFVQQPGGATVDVTPPPPQLTQSIAPAEVISDGNMTVGVGSPAIEDVIGQEGVERMLNDDIDDLPNA